MQTEARVDLETYLDRAPDPVQNKLRYEWHLERYRFAIRFVNQAEKAADVGCGWGFGTEFLGRISRQAYGYEINPQLVDYASSRFKRSNIRFGVHDILEGPLPESPYDLICLFEVIEHLEEPCTGLVNLKNSLAERGVLVLSTPNITGGESDHPHHALEFNHKTLEALLNSRFQNVQMFSQGAPASEDRVTALLGRVDIFRLRRLFSRREKKRILDQVSSPSGQDVMNNRLLRISPGCHPDAKWSLAICS